MDYKTIRGKFWDGRDKDENDDQELITYKFDEDGFKHAILRAFRDLTQRTMTRKNKNESVSTKSLRDYVCNKDKYTGEDQYSFLELINDYFDGKYTDYIAWHKLACKFILTCLAEFYEDKSVSYGKAQKIVNMTMKGIYCLEGADKHIEKFQPCHMALDSFTLEWFYRCSNSVKYKNDIKVMRKNLTTWSNLTESKNGDVFGYYDIQDGISKLVEKIKENKQLDITPFEAEFYIWPQMQITIAAEALYSNFKDQKELDDFKEKLVKEKYNLLKKLFNSTECEDPCFI